MTIVPLAPTGRTTVRVLEMNLEDADYEGPSLPMPQRIAAALNHKLALHLIPTEAKVRQT